MIKKKIGTFFIIVSLLIVLGIYLPYLEAYMPSHFTYSSIGKEEFIAIDKIHAYAPIIENVDPNNPSDYQKALLKGVALAKGFSSIGKAGTIYLFAHSSLAPWQMTRINTAFLRLDELQNGDLVKLFKNGHEYDYSVFGTEVVSPLQTAFLYKHQNELILQTCTPIGTDWNRLLVFARPKF